jgi:hypothetical protein
MIGGPSKKEIGALVSSKTIENFPVDRIDDTHARKRFGPHLQGVRGETVRRRPDPVVESHVSVPRETILVMKVVKLSADVFFINEIPMLLTLSQRIKFLTTAHAPSRTTKQFQAHKTCASNLLPCWY